MRETMALKRGRFGQFLACTGYPECKTTRRSRAGTRTPKKPDVALDETCPQCGQAKLMLKEGASGIHFLRQIIRNQIHQAQTVGVPCPKPGCGDELIERRSEQRGRFSTAA